MQPRLTEDVWRDRRAREICEAGRATKAARGHGGTQLRAGCGGVVVVGRDADNSSALRAVAAVLQAGRGTDLGAARRSYRTPRPRLEECNIMRLLFDLR